MGRHGTIAGRKAAQDSKRAAMFTKYARAITVAAKDGGDPEYNAGLRLAIDKAKAISMPNDNITRAIKKGTGELGGVSYEELMFEGYGVGGVAVIVEAVTDNTNRTTSAVRSCMDKYGGNLGTPGCVSYMFEKKGVLVGCLINFTEGMIEMASLDGFRMAVACKETYVDKNVSVIVPAKILNEISKLLAEQESAESVKISIESKKNYKPTIATYCDKYIFVPFI